MSITNPIIAQKVSDLLDSWRTRELQMREWISGAADGGPYGDGRYPLSDYLGVVRYTYCPAALEAGVAGSSSAAAVSAAAAAASVLLANAAQAAAEGARDLALAYRNAAQAAQTAAETARDNAANSEANALTHRNAASASATAAAGSATSAATSATASASSATASSGSASAAAASAAAAAASALAAATFDPANFYTKTAADARFRQLSVAITNSDITSLAYSKLTGVPSTFAPDLTAAYTWTGLHTFRSAAIRLRAVTDTTADATYLTWSNAAVSVERAWAGFGSNGSNTFTINNQVGALNLVGFSGVTVNGTAVSVSGHTHAASDITSGVLAAARMGTGTANSGSFLRGDGQWTNQVVGAVGISGILTVASSDGGQQIHLRGDTSYITFFNSADSTRSGYLQFNAGGAAWLDNETGGNVNLAMSGTSMLQINSNATETRKQLRATGWYGGNGTLGGAAAELGYSGGSAYLIGYDRSSSGYVPLTLAAASLTFQATSGGAQLVANAGNRQWRFDGTTNSSYFFNGTNEDLYLRQGKNAGTVYIGQDGTGSDVMEVRGTSASPNVRIRSINGAPYALELYREDYAAGSKVFAHKYDGTNIGWSFEHRPYMPGLREGGGSSAYINFPLANGSNYRWDFRGHTAGTAAIYVADAAAATGAYLYASGSDMGLLNNAGSWSLRYNSSNAAWESHDGNKEFAANGFRYVADYSFYLYNSASYSYGSWRIGGVRGGYVGLILDTGKNWTFMSSGTNVGLYNQVDGRWGFYDDGSNSYVSKPLIDYSSSQPYLKYASGQATNGGKITVSTSAASGTPDNGDLWFQRAA